MNKELCIIGIILIFILFNVISYALGFKRGSTLVKILDDEIFESILGEIAELANTSEKSEENDDESNT